MIKITLIALIVFLYLFAGALIGAFMEVDDFIAIFAMFWPVVTLIMVPILAATYVYDSYKEWKWDRTFNREEKNND